MAQPADTFDSYDAVGNREDLLEAIFDISPIETPLLSLAGRDRAEATKHEWQTDVLAAAADNAVIEGDDATTDAVTATVRVGNYTQIGDKVARVTGTQRAVNSAGRSDEMEYQVARRAQELKRDLEFSALSRNASVAGSATIARKSGGLSAWLTSNTSNGATGANGGYSTTTGLVVTVTNGTARALNEDQVKTVIKSAYDNGGNPDTILIDPFNKQQFSAFTGNASRFDKAEDSVLHTAVDVYVSDFGRHKVVPDRFFPTYTSSKDALLVDMDMVKFAFLRDFQTMELAKTGDTDRRQVIVEWTLQVSNQAAHGAVRDLTLS